MPGDDGLKRAHPRIGGLWSLLGAAVGYFTLWGVVEAGKMAFGKKRVVLPRAEEFHLAARGGW